MKLVPMSISLVGREVCFTSILRSRLFIYRINNDTNNATISDDTIEASIIVNKISVNRVHNIGY